MDKWSDVVQDSIGTRVLENGKKTAYILNVLETVDDRLPLA